MIPIAFMHKPNVSSGGGGGGGANLNLSNLVISAGALAPAFAAGTTGYTVSVPNGVTSVTVTPSTAGSAVITVQGLPVASGQVSGAIALAVGATSIAVVTDGGGGNTMTYTIVVTRAAGSGNSPPNPAALDYNFGGIFGKTLSVTVTNPNSHDMTIAFNNWPMSEVSWITAFPLLIPAGTSKQVTAKGTHSGGRFTSVQSGTVGGTWQCGADSGTISAHGQS